MFPGGTVLIAGNVLVVFPQKTSADEVLLGMVNDLPVAVHEVDILLGNVLVDLFQQLLDTAVVHIYQKDTLHRAAVVGEFHGTTQGNDPVITVGGVVKKVLHMGCGKVKVFQLIHCVLKPLLVRDRNSCFHVSDGSRRHEAAVPRIAGNAHQIVLVGLVEKIHLLIQPLGGQVLVLDDTVVHGIGDPAHAPQVILQADGRLV